MPAAARCCCFCCCCCCCCSSAASLDRSGVDASIDATDEAVDDEGVCGCRPAFGVTAGARDCTGVACGVLGGATEDDDDDEEEEEEDEDALRAVVDR